MIEMYQLRQLIAFAKSGSLSRAAEELHLSQPALSRSMKRIEDELKVELFTRKKNFLALNENGKLAVSGAEKVMEDIRAMAESVRALDQSRRTITIGAWAPAPLWEAIPTLTISYPDKTIASVFVEEGKLLKRLMDGICQLAIFTHPVKLPGIYCIPWDTEELSFLLPKNHPLAASSGLHFSDLDGEAILLFSRIGFWLARHKTKMPRAHFLMQEERAVFSELVKASEIPAFTSDHTVRREGVPKGRTVVPILDDEAKAEYYCCCLDENKAKFDGFLSQAKIA